MCRVVCWYVVVTWCVPCGVVVWSVLVFSTVCNVGVVCGCVVLACCREHVVVLVVRVMCLCTCHPVLFFCVMCTIVVPGEAWHAENPPVCTFKTSPCVPATAPECAVDHNKKHLLLLPPC